MSELLVQGLEISVLGMGLTFAALGLLILAMVLLERLFREGDEEKVGSTAVSLPPEPIEEEIAAAIAAAITHWQAEETAVLGANLQKPHSPWWRAHGSEL